MQTRAPVLTVLSTPAEFQEYFAAVKQAHFLVRFGKSASVLLDILIARFKREQPPCQLSFSGCALTLPEAQQLVDILNLNKNVYLVELPYQSLEVVNLVIPALVHVEAVDLSFSAFDQRLFCQAHLGKLRKLVLCGLSVSQELARRCVEFPLLQYLDLSFGELQNGAITELLRIHQMEFLGLSNVVFNQPQVVTQFVRLACTVSARTDIQGTELTDEAFEAAFTGCLQNSRFQEFNARGCGAKCSARINQLKSQLIAKNPNAAVNIDMEAREVPVMSPCAFMLQYLQRIQPQTVFQVADIPVLNRHEEVLQNAANVVRDTVHKLQLTREDAIDLTVHAETLTETLRQSQLVFDNVIELDQWQMDGTALDIQDHGTEELSWDFNPQQAHEENQMIATLQQSQLQLSQAPVASTTLERTYTPRSRNSKRGVTFCDFESKSPKISLDSTAQRDLVYIQKARQLYADSPGADMEQIAELLKYEHTCEFLDEAVRLMDYPRTKQNYELAKTEEDGIPTLSEYRFVFGVTMQPEDQQQIRLKDYIDFKIQLEGQDRTLRVGQLTVQVDDCTLYFDSGLQYNVEVASKVIVDMHDFFSGLTFTIREEDTNYFRQVMSVRSGDYQNVFDDVGRRESVLWDLGRM